MDSSSRVRDSKWPVGRPPDGDKVVLRINNNSDCGDDESVLSNWKFNEREDNRESCKEENIIRALRTRRQRTRGRRESSNGNENSIKKEEQQRGMRNGCDNDYDLAGMNNNMITELSDGNNSIECKTSLLEVTRDKLLKQTTIVNNNERKLLQEEEDINRKTRSTRRFNSLRVTEEIVDKRWWSSNNKDESDTSSSKNKKHFTSTSQQQLNNFNSTILSERKKVIQADNSNSNSKRERSASITSDYFSSTHNSPSTNCTNHINETSPHQVILKINHHNSHYNLQNKSKTIEKKSTIIYENPTFRNNKTCMRDDINKQTGVAQSESKMMIMSPSSSSSSASQAAKKHQAKTETETVAPMKTYPLEFNNDKKVCNRKR